MPFQSPSGSISFGKNVYAMEESTRLRKREVEEQLLHTRSRRTQSEAQFQVCRRDIESITARLAHESKDYRLARKLLVHHIVKAIESIRAVQGDGHHALFHFAENECVHD